MTSGCLLAELPSYAVRVLTNNTSISHDVSLIGTGVFLLLANSLVQVGQLVAEQRLRVVDKIGISCGQPS